MMHESDGDNVSGPDFWQQWLAIGTYFHSKPIHVSSLAATTSMANGSQLLRLLTFINEADVARPDHAIFIEIMSMRQSRQPASVAKFNILHSLALQRCFVGSRRVRLWLKSTGARYRCSRCVRRA